MGIHGAGRGRARRVNREHELAARGYGKWRAGVELYVLCCYACCVRDEGLLMSPI